MHYLDVAAAREHPGLRLVLTAGGPGPWSEAAKAIFSSLGVSFAAVRQDGAKPNAELLAWCGHRNAPVAIYRDEPARAGWADILFLAERLAAEPRLIPDDAGERALALGLCHELCGEQGLGWSRRLAMIHATLTRREQQGKPSGRMGYIGSLYGYTPLTGAAATARVAGLLQMLADRLHTQQRAGRRFFVGDRLSAVDLYWAAFSQMFAPLPAEQCPMPEALRESYTVTDPEILDALDRRLLDHRDLVFDDYVELPLDF